MKRLLLNLLLVLVLFSVASALELPPNMQKIIESNNELASSFALNISFLIAFVAGVIGILSPCILPILPAYFSFTFKEKRNITKMTLVFFFGFSLVFVTMGVIAGFIGEQSISVLQNDWLVIAGGVVLIILGLMAFQGKGFSSFFKVSKRFSNDVPGVFMTGVSFAVGWTACLGPILGGILGIGALLGNVLYAGFLLFFYSLGNFLPLFIFSVFYDKFNFSKFLKDRVVQFGDYKVHLSNLVSGVLFLFIGLFLVIFRSTALFNTIDPFGTKNLFYSLQNDIMTWDYTNILGLITLIALVITIIFFIKKKSNKKIK